MEIFGLAEFNCIWFYSVSIQNIYWPQLINPWNTSSSIHIFYLMSTWSMTASSSSEKFWHGRLQEQLHKPRFLQPSPILSMVGKNCFLKRICWFKIMDFTWGRPPWSRAVGYQEFQGRRLLKSQPLGKQQFSFPCSDSSEFLVVFFIHFPANLILWKISTLSPDFEHVCELFYLWRQHPWWKLEREARKPFRKYIHIATS